MFRFNKTHRRRSNRCPIDCGRDNPAGITGSFACREESLDLRVHVGLLVTRDADGG